MKNTLISLALSLLLPIDLMGQLTFEVVNSPKEYNVISMVKLPQGDQYRKVVLLAEMVNIIFMWQHEFNRQTKTVFYLTPLTKVIHIESFTFQVIAVYLYGITL